VDLSDGANLGYAFGRRGISAGPKRKRPLLREAGSPERQALHLLPFRRESHKSKGGGPLIHRETITPDRLTAFSDGVFAVIVTVMVLELKAPNQPEFRALWSLWPSAISYALSYLFIAIIWVNHHHLMRFVNHLMPALIWINFAHLFLVSFLPFATAWIARAELASSPVVL
jgi:Endosomal/lysosomal potassium channel TMEM175